MRKFLLLLPLVALNAFHHSAQAKELGREKARDVVAHLKNAQKFQQMGQTGLACEEGHLANTIMSIWFNEIKEVADDPFEWRIRVQALANECFTKGHMP